MASLSEIDSVVPILSSGITEAGDPYLVMPLFTGGSLQNRLSDGPIPWRDALQQMRQIAQAVNQAHKNNILHLDIKPANILLDDAGHPHLGDFGIAEIMGSTASMSAAMMTPAYTPPERLADSKPTEQTDVYGLGATLFALLTARPPFGADAKTNPAAVLASVLNDQVPVEALPDDVPTSVRNIILRTMAKDPATRPKSITELGGMLKAASENGSVEPPELIDTNETVVRLDTNETVVRPAAVATSQAVAATETADPNDTSRSKALWLLAAAVTALLLAGGVAFGLASGGEPEQETVAAGTVAESEAEELDEEPDSDEDASEEQEETAQDDTDEADSEVLGATLEEEDTDLAPSDSSEDAQSANAETTQTSSPTNESERSSESDQAKPEAPPITGTSTSTTTTTTTSTTAAPQVEQAAAVAAPEASFSTSTRSTETNTSIRFTSTSSGDIDSISWSFGDGTSGSGNSINHSWSSAGTYTVRMTARGIGGTDTTSTSVTITAPQVSAPPRPDQVGCQYHLNNDVDVQWAFSPLPSLVDTYVLEFNNGTRQDIGRQPGPYSTTDNALSAIIAVKDGVESATNVGGCEAHGGVKPAVGLPELPRNVTCRFHDFFVNAQGVYTWSETWNWTAGADTTSFTMVINQDGNIISVPNGASTTHTTVGVNGQSNSGRSVKGITSVGPNGEQTLTIANCGAMGGTGWQPRPTG